MFKMCVPAHDSQTEREREGDSERAPCCVSLCAFELVNYS